MQNQSEENQSEEDQKHAQILACLEKHGVHPSGDEQQMMVVWEGPYCQCHHCGFDPDIHSKIQQEWLDSKSE